MEDKKVKPSEKMDALAQNVMAQSKRVGEMEMVVYTLSRENEILKQALQMLDKKLSAVVGLLNENKPLTDEEINNHIVGGNVAQLKRKVDEFVEQGQLKVAENIENMSFVVAAETNEQGEVENPRIQFMLNESVAPDLVEKLIGAKVGDTIVTAEGKLDLKILEIYNLAQSTQEPTEELPQEVPEEQSVGVEMAQQPTEEVVEHQEN